MELVGPWYDYLWTVIAVIAIALLGAALNRWFRASQSEVLALVAIVIVPIIGPAAYLLATSHGREQGETDGAHG